MASSMNEAERAAASKRFDEIMDKGSKEFARKLGPVRVYGGENMPMKVLSEEFKKSARKKIN